MKTVDYDLWKFGDEYHKLYLEDKSLIDKISNVLGVIPSGYYMNKDVEYGWDILIPNKRVTEIKRIIRAETKPVKPTKERKRKIRISKIKPLKVRSRKINVKEIYGPGDDNYGRNKLSEKSKPRGPRGPYKSWKKEKPIKKKTVKKPVKKIIKPKNIKPRNVRIV